MVSQIKELLTERSAVTKAGANERLLEINRSLTELAAKGMVPAARAARRITNGSERR
jgi:hypothetical protein